MKIINIEVYTFSELEKEIQEKVLDDLRYINTEHDWWETDCDDFVSILTLIGIRTSPQEIYCSGFWSQGDGSTFASTIDIIQFVNGIKNQSWRIHAPNLELEFPPFHFDKRILRLIENDHIEVTMWTEIPNNGYWLKYRSEIRFSDHKNRLTNIENELEKLEIWAAQSLKILNNHLYESLKNSCEYLSSDKAVQESIEENEHHFSADGEPVDWLINLSEQ